MANILIVDDEVSITSSLATGLGRHGHTTFVAHDGNQALEMAQAHSIDLVLLDVMLPGKTGLEVCAELRAQKHPARILMLTARTDVTDRVVGLTLGADDYLGKPFEFAELMARVGAMLRRTSAVSGPQQYTVGPYELNESKVEVRRNGAVVPLSPREYALFRLLMSNPDTVVSRDTILTEVWERQEATTSAVVDVYVGYLREKLDPDRTHIVTVRGAGYRLIP